MNFIEFIANRNPLQILRISIQHKMLIYENKLQPKRLKILKFNNKPIENKLLEFYVN